MKRLMHAEGRSVPRMFVEEIRRSLGDADHLEILDAGCGRGWRLDLDGIPHRITGVDSDAEAVRHRRELVQDLEESYVGDLLDVDLPTSAFDVVHSSFVLEHLSGAEQALDRFFQWLRPGGLLLLEIPDRDSAFGFASRITPFWLHVLYRRYVFHQPTAGKPGHAPYPTFYDPVTSARGMREYCRVHGHAILQEYGVPISLARFGRLAPLFTATLKLVELLSVGRLASSHSNLAYVVRKQ